MSLLSPPPPPPPHIVDEFVIPTYLLIVVGQPGREGGRYQMCLKGKEERKKEEGESNLDPPFVKQVGEEERSGN